MSTRKLFFLGIFLLIVASISYGLFRTRHYPRQTLSQDMVRNDFYIYKLEWGETWGSIAAKFGLSIEALRFSNPNLFCPNCLLIYNEVNIPVQSTFSVIEVEWPAEMDVDRSDTIRISLIPVNVQQVFSTAEVSGHTAISMTPLPMLGTPAVPMKDAFGPQYEVCVIASLQGSAFEIKSTTTEDDCKPFDQYPVTWDWSIYPRSDGPQSIISSVEIHWDPKEMNKNAFQTQIWRYRFETNVKARFIKTGQLNIATLISGFLGTLLSIPWIYERIKERRKIKDKKMGKASFK